MNRVPDSVVRAGRTFLQAFVAAFAAAWFAGNYSTTVPDYTALKSLAIAASLAGFTALLSFVQNALEDHTSVPTVK